MPYITPDSNIITINKSLEKEAILKVDLKNPASNSYSDLFAYSITDAEGHALADAPVSVIGAGKQAVISPLRSG